MSVDLYDEQKKAVENMSNGCILCGGVGTGKSRTALAYYYTKVCGGKLPKKGGKPLPKPIFKPLYIITTAKKRDTKEWELELSHFCIDLKTVVIDSWNNIKKYSEIGGSFFIFDEQRISGFGAWSKSFIKISKTNEWILLTATPGDRWIDYATVFIANGFYRNITEFRNRHVVYHRYSKYPKIEKYIDTKRLERIRDMLVVPMDNMKTATKHHQWIKVGYSESEYNQTVKSRWNMFKQEPVRNASEMCYLLRKIVNNDIRRLDAVSNIMSQHCKCIIFYSFDYELERLRHFGNVTGIPYSEWNGHKHEPILYDEPKWMYFVNYSSGSEGWNCIETDTIIFYSQNYSYRQTLQACGRIDRLNTPYKDLYYYHLFSDSSIDKEIKSCLVKKKKFNEAVFVSDCLSR